MKLEYFSDISGIDGKIKTSPEDFLVEEITPGGQILELDRKFDPFNALSTPGNGKFVHFVLQKKNWTTQGAVKQIAESLRTTFRRFNFAGSKDKNAITTQLVSCFGLKKGKIENIKVKDIKILGSWYDDQKIDLGDLLGNRFAIKLRDCDTDAEKKVKRIYSQMNGKFPNYFGEQRFGSTRQNTHLVGEKIIKGDFESACMLFLCDSKGEENQEASLAREELKNTRDYSLAIKNFPHHLKLERCMLVPLEKNSNDYVNAFRKLPRSTLLMFVHAFQSYLFNLMLSERIVEKNIKKEEGEYFCGENTYGFPDVDKKTDDENKGWLSGKIIGYETQINEREKKILDMFKITKEHFLVRKLPEVSSKGTFRTLFAPFIDFSFSEDTFRFSLQSGSYATSALREFIDKKE